MPVVVPFSTTVTVTVAMFASDRSTVDGVIPPCSSTFTGTVTTLLSFFTVTVPAVGTGTSFTVASPLPSVVASCFFPSSSTMVTVAPSTLVPLSVTVTGTDAVAFASAISLGAALPLPSTARVTVPSVYPALEAVTPL